MWRRPEALSWLLNHVRRDAHKVDLTFLGHINAYRGYASCLSIYLFVHL